LIPSHDDLATAHRKNRYPVFNSSPGASLPYIEAADEIRRPDCIGPLLAIFGESKKNSGHDNIATGIRNNDPGITN
jgi:hypothetical protein